MRKASSSPGQQAQRPASPSPLSFEARHVEVPLENKPIWPSGIQRPLGNPSRKVHLQLALGKQAGKLAQAKPDEQQSLCSAVCHQAAQTA